MAITLNPFTGQLEIVGTTGGGGGGGTVTNTSVATANGFSGTVSAPTTTPTITLSTTVTGILKGNGTGLVAATAGTDYLIPGSVSQYFVNEFTLSSTDITNKFVTLAQAPTDPTLALLNVIGGPMQDYGPDFIVSGSSLSWSGLFLDGVLSSGDKLKVQFD